MKFKFIELTDFQNWCIVHSIVCKYPKGSKDYDNFHKAWNSGAENEINLTINGFEINPMDFINEFERQSKRMIDGKANDLIDEKLSREFQDLRLSSQEMKKLRKSFCKKMKIKYEEEEY
jgi:hypothetical protein